MPNFPFFLTIPYRDMKLWPIPPIPTLNKFWTIKMPSRSLSLEPSLVKGFTETFNLKRANNCNYQQKALTLHFFFLNFGCQVDFPNRLRARNNSRIEWKPELYLAQNDIILKVEELFGIQVKSPPNLLLPSFHLE